MPDPSLAAQAMPAAVLLDAYTATLRRLDWMADREGLGLGEAADKAREWAARAEVLRAEILRRMVKAPVGFPAGTRVRVKDCPSDPALVGAVGETLCETLSSAGPDHVAVRFPELNRIDMVAVAGLVAVRRAAP